MGVGAWQAGTLPPGAIPIVRSAQAAGTLYTVPAGRRLYVTSAYVSMAHGAAGAAGAMEIVASALVGDANARVLVGVASDVNAADTNSNATQLTPPAPIPAAATVALTLTGAVGAAVTGGFSGYETFALPGAGAI